MQRKLAHLGWQMLPLTVMACCWLAIASARTSLASERSSCLLRGYSPCTMLSYQSGFPKKILKGTMQFR